MKSCKSPQMNEFTSRVAQESQIYFLLDNGTDFHVEYEFNNPRPSNHETTIKNNMF